MFDCVVLLTFDLDLRVAGGGVFCDQMEEGGEPGSWSALTRNLVSPGPRVAVELYYFAPAARVLPRLGPGRALSISPLPGCSSQRSALYTARFESRLVFGVEQTGATLRAPQIFEFFASLSVNKSVHL